MTAPANEKFSDSLLPGGFSGVIALLIAAIIGILVWCGPENASRGMVLLLIMFVAASFLGNLPTSPFERRFRLVSSHFGGGATGAFHMAYPLTRLLIYHEGLEFRLLFQRYFVPFDRMPPPTAEKSFFTALVVRPEAPGLPKYLRFGTFGSAEVIARVRAHHQAAPRPTPRAS